MERALKVFLRKFGAVATLAKITIKTWFEYCREHPSKLTFNGIFREPREKEDSIDTILYDYILTLMSREDDPNRKSIAYTMMKPMLCAPITLNMMFGRVGIRGSKAWQLVYEYESNHTSETLKLSKADYVKLFRSVIDKFKKLKFPLSRKKRGTNSWYMVAGTLVLVLSCVLLYRYGNLLDRFIDPVKQDETEAPLEKLITFLPNAENPETIRFSTLEKTDKATGKKTPGRPVLHEVRSSMLDPLVVISAYAKAHGKYRGNLEGPILKAKSAQGGNLVFNPFTRANYASWIRQLPERLDMELKSLGGKDLTPAVIRRSAMSYFASITDIKNVQALAGHRNIATTANIYVGLKDEEIATLRAGLSETLLGITQAIIVDKSR